MIWWKRIRSQIPPRDDMARGDDKANRFANFLLDRVCKKVTKWLFY